MEGDQDGVFEEGFIERFGDEEDGERAQGAQWQMAGCTEGVSTAGPPEGLTRSQIDAKPPRLELIPPLISLPAHIMTHLAAHYITGTHRAGLDGGESARDACKQRRKSLALIGVADGSIVGGTVVAAAGVELDQMTSERSRGL
ncbi:unnamed protein product [Arctogadus glacialis]